MLKPSAHNDIFARDNLPPPDQWPDLLLEDFDYPDQLKAACELTDWTNRLAHALSDTRLMGEMTACNKENDHLETVVGFDGAAKHDGEFDRLALEKPVRFDAVPASRDDAAIAPYEFPRSIIFTEALPKTESSRTQRFELKDMSS